MTGLNGQTYNYFAQVNWDHDYESFSSALHFVPYYNIYKLQTALQYLQTADHLRYHARGYGYLPLDGWFGGKVFPFRSDFAQWEEREGRGNRVKPRQSGLGTGVCTSWVPRLGTSVVTSGRTRYLTSPSPMISSCAIFVRKWLRRQSVYSSGLPLGHLAAVWIYHRAGTDGSAWGKQVKSTGLP